MPIDEKTPLEKPLSATEFYCALNGQEISALNDSQGSASQVYEGHVNVLLGNNVLSMAHFPSAEKKLDSAKAKEIHIIAQQLNFYLNQGREVIFLADTNTNNANSEIVLQIIKAFADCGVYTQEGGIIFEHASVDKSRSADSRYNQQSHIKSKVGSTASQTMLGLKFTDKIPSDQDRYWEVIGNEIVDKQTHVGKVKFSPLLRTVDASVFDHGVLEYDIQYKNSAVMIPATLIFANFTDLRAMDTDKQFISTDSIPDAKSYQAYVDACKPFMRVLKEQLNELNVSEPDNAHAKQACCNEFLKAIWTLPECQTIRSCLKDENKAYLKIQKDLHKYFGTTSQCEKYNKTLDKHETIIKSLASLQAFGGFEFPGLNKSGHTFEQVMNTIYKNQMDTLLELEEKVAKSGKLPILLGIEANSPGFREELNARRAQRVLIKEAGRHANDMASLALNPVLHDPAIESVLSQQAPNRNTTTHNTNTSKLNPY